LSLQMHSLNASEKRTSTDEGIIICSKWCAFAESRDCLVFDCPCKDYFAEWCASWESMIRDDLDK
jgi:hypothetical protein